MSFSLPSQFVSVFLLSRYGVIVALSCFFYSSMNTRKKAQFVLSAMGWRQFFFVFYFRLCSKLNCNHFKWSIFVSINMLTKGKYRKKYMKKSPFQYGWHCVCSFETIDAKLYASWFLLIFQINSYASVKKIISAEFHFIIPNVAKSVIQRYMPTGFIYIPILWSTNECLCSFYLLVSFSNCWKMDLF